MLEKTKRKSSPTRILVFGILVTILIGTVLLKLPICNNKSITWIDSMFTTTSAVCVTGLVTINVSEQFSILGQIIILILIQIGGLRIYDVYITYIHIYWKEDKLIG